MSQIFPKKINKLLPLLVAIKLIVVVSAVFFIWYYFSPQYTDVGYRPVQPIAYSHKFHAGDLGIDCRYCHTGVETGRFAQIPPTQVCMNCHSMVGKDNPKLAPLFESWETGKPIQWVRVHDLPDYSYFNHAAHIRAQIGCESCHGNVSQMEVVTRVKPLSMGWCLDCHRNPAPHIRPQNMITRFDWKPTDTQITEAQKIMLEKNINPKTECSVCHR
ncbi:MAG: cytochrome c3 family protein [Bdellovibrionales bacterium]|nr:cytochrome c3 family protein [Bdellovibrionales bacterium]